MQCKFSADDGDSDGLGISTQDAGSERDGNGSLRELSRGN